jgi:hypothetical protein
VQSSEIDATLTDFPVFVDLSELPADFFDAVQSDGDDIRITSSDGTTEVPLEMVAIDTSGAPSCVSACTGEVHFKASSLSSSSDTDFYIYYGNVGAAGYATTDTYGAENVWTNSYLGVWHMNEDPSGSSPQIVDSVGTHDGTSSGTMTTGDLVSGKLGSAIVFDGTDDYITVSADGTDLDLDGSAVTVVGWISRTSFGSFASLISKGDASQYNLKQHQNNQFEGKVGDTSSFSGTSYSSSGEWYHVVLTNDLSNNVLYVDGAQVDSDGEGGTQNETYPVEIGRDSQNTTRYTNGTIDEIRISSVARSAEWIAASYTNQETPSGFYSAGSEEVQSGGATWAFSEDVGYTDLETETTVRLRFLVANNSGSDASGNVYYTLEVSGPDPSTCATGSYLAITDAGEDDWAMSDSLNLTNGEATTDNLDITNTASTFVASEALDTSDAVTSPIALHGDEFTEIEFSIEATALATEGATYCFRLTDAGSVTNFTYTSYPEATIATDSSLSFSISDVFIGFGDLLTGVPRFATGDGFGTSTAVIAHTFSAETTAVNGYNITIEGSTLTSGGYTIDPIGGTATSSSPGTEQFGMRLTASGGSGVVSSPYSSSLYAFIANSPSTIATLSSGDGVTTTYSAYYIANAAALTEEGNYSTVLQYTIIANF